MFFKHHLSITVTIPFRIFEFFLRSTFVRWNVYGMSMYFNVNCYQINIIGMLDFNSLLLRLILFYDV